MPVADIRAKYDPAGKYAGEPDAVFLKRVADFESGAGTPGPTTPSSVFMAVPKAAAGFVKSAATDIGNIPRGLVADPLSQVLQNRPATPEEESRSFSGLAGLTGLLTAPGVGRAAEATLGRLPGLLGKVAAGAGAGAALGAGDAAIRSGGKVQAIPGGAVGGAVLGGALGGILPKAVPADESMPQDFTSKLARSPAGPLVSSVTDRLRAMGAAGQDVEQMIEKVVQQSQREPGQHLQPFDQAVHAITGRKGKLPEDARSLLRGALQGRVDPKTLPENLTPLYQQMKGYFGQTVQRGTEVGAMVKRGKEAIPLAEAAMEHYYPQRAVTVDALKHDADLRSSIERNLQDLGIARSPEEAAATLKDYMTFIESEGKTGGQLAIAAHKGLNPDATPAQLRYQILQKKPALRQPASGLEHAREMNSPFYEPRPEVAFPQHVVDTERALAEIQHYGQDASKLTGRMADLPTGQQNLAQHLVRTATESHEPWDPGLTAPLSFLRKAQLSLFTPITSAKNLSQRANTALTSDVPEALTRGIVATPGAVKTGARSGALAEGAHETLAQALGEKPGVMARYLKAIGFTPVERGNRQTAAQTGLKEAEKYAARLAKNPNDELARYRLLREGIAPDRPIGPDETLVYQGRRAGREHPTKFFTGHRGMAEQFAGPGGKVKVFRESDIPPEAYQLDDRFPIELREQRVPPGADYWKQRGEAHWAGFAGPNAPKPVGEYRYGEAPVTIESLLKGAGKLTPREADQAALMRSNRAQFRTHPKDLPDWFTSNPVTRTAALFKSFDYQQTRLVLDETLGRLSSGKPGDKARGLRNVAILGTLYPLIGEGVNDIYSVILRRESPQHVAQRTKEWADDTAKVATGRMNPVDYANKYKARYGEDILAGSAPGAGGGLIQAMQYGKGDKGASLLRGAVGPAISRPYEAVQLGKDVLTQKEKSGADKPMTPAQQRQMLRLIFGGAGSVAAPWLFPPKNAAGQKAANQ